MYSSILPVLLLAALMMENTFPVHAQIECTLPAFHCCPSNLPPCPPGFTTTYQTYPEFTSTPPPLLPPLTRPQGTPQRRPTTTLTTTVYVTATSRPGTTSPTTTSSEETEPSPTGTTTATSEPSEAPWSSTATTSPSTATESQPSDGCITSTAPSSPTRESVTVTRTIQRQPAQRTPRPPLTSTAPKSRFTLPTCSTRNLGQQMCSNQTSFVICNTDQKWTQPMRCPAGTVCKPFPGNASFVLCDFAVSQRQDDEAPADNLFFRHRRERKRLERELKLRRKYGA